MSTAVADLELHLKGLVLVTAILDWRGASKADLDKHREEIRRVRERIAELRSAEGGGAYSVAA
jgi:hypothetical protein